MTTTSIEYADRAGKVFSGVLFSPPSVSGPRPGVLVLHGGAGLGEHEQERASRLAELGYVGFAPDLFGEKLEDRARRMAVIQALVADPLLLRERVNAALGRLRTEAHVDAARTAAIGFCFGGLAALELARSGADVGAVVSFHGGLHTASPARPGETKARILVCTGSDDPFVTREHRTSFEDEMARAGADWEMSVYGGALHGFTERAMVAGVRPGCGYQREADRRSWRAMCDWLAEAFET
jgi:dienelactone hydrolase